MKLSSSIILSTVADEEGVPVLLRSSVALLSKEFEQTGVGTKSLVRQPG